MADKVLIIGSGLGGLECGYILAKNGFDVTVLEQSSQCGGCMQSFFRKGQEFDSGFHYVGGLDEGQSLYPFFKYFGLLDLPWHRMDPDCFDEVSFAGGQSGIVESFPLACGYDRFAESLSGFFPDEKADLKAYSAFLKKLGDNTFKSANSFGPDDLFGVSAYDFICKSFRNPLLRKVISGTSIKMELDAETLPLYVFAQINNSFIQSSWRLRGCGSLITDKLVKAIREMGGKVLCNAKVIGIGGENGSAEFLKVSFGGDPVCEETLKADWVISDIHPESTMELLGGDLRVRKIYRERIYGLKNTFGIFTVNVSLKKGRIPYLNRNIYIHKADADLWHPETSHTESVMVSFYVPEERYDGVISDRGLNIPATHLDILSPMSWDDVSDWGNCPEGHRGEEYENIKKKKALECIDLASERLPGLKDAIEDYWTSSPLTYKSRTGSPSGSAYGIRKDWHNPMMTLLSSRTPVSNLLLTGQSLNLHGLLGVSMTSVITCREILKKF
ncbi:MAG: NAD(P)/FAD-dependent oxidoreductase [Bacteroidales bacterium]|jgi:all-trans-retinol 13,14-reductase|nr:NAD(P)/FAD-dependent oxidoreductase [Bacteroidales bacterium]